jgi:AP-1-like factor
MDYSYFNGAPQPYQFLGLPPTPGHTGSAASDEFSNSPPVRDQFHYVPRHSQTFLTPRQDAFDHFQNFDAFNQHFNDGVPKPPTPQSQHKPSISGVGNQAAFDTSSNFNMEANDDSTRRGGSNSDDDDMTPAQSRRKAQNRAA